MSPTLAAPDAVSMRTLPVFKAARRLLISIREVSGLPVKVQVTGSLPTKEPPALGDVVISILVGSMYQSPASPCAAPTSTKPSTPTYSRPDTSTLPPSPASRPPVAVMRASAANQVARSASTTTSPALPRRSALTSTAPPACKAIASSAVTVTLPPAPSPAARAETDPV